MKGTNKIKETIEEYNKYRSPESHATLFKQNVKSFVINFSGTYCRTCGFYDYFEDFRLMLETKGVETKMTTVKEKEDGAYVTFKLK
ncbi:TPA: hypothetical protein HA265_04590 [Candidatus Woesearchaeota archaeon]|nr:hypothetical protein [Candidatus Woesearchaeota archaeon]